MNLSASPRQTYDGNYNPKSKVRGRWANPLVWRGNRGVSGTLRGVLGTHSALPLVVSRSFEFGWSPVDGAPVWPLGNSYAMS